MSQKQICYRDPGESGKDKREKSIESRASGDNNNIIILFVVGFLALNSRRHTSSSMINSQNSFTCPQYRTLDKRCTRTRMCSRNLAPEEELEVKMNSHFEGLTYEVDG
jgi:hypothetical protein